jgi:hypothetical protein
LKVFGRADKSACEFKFGYVPDAIFTLESVAGKHEKVYHSHRDSLQLEPEAIVGGQR